MKLKRPVCILMLLAYPIEDETEGYYVIYTFQSTPDYPADLSRRLNLSDGVLRSLVTVID